MLRLKTYYDGIKAQDCIALLESNGVDAVIKIVPPTVNPAINGAFNQVEPIDVMVKEDDFKKANEILKQYAESQELDPNPYLLEFSVEELYSMFEKQDEWSEFDLLSARQLLKSKGSPIDESEIEELSAKRLENLSKPDEVQKHWLLIAYLGIVFGGFLAILMGSMYDSSMITLPNGNKVPRYTESVRRQGRIIRFFGFFSLVIMILRLWLFQP
jgi:hypothetical protein